MCDGVEKTKGDFPGERFAIGRRNVGLECLLNMATDELEQGGCCPKTLSQYMENGRGTVWTLLDTMRCLGAGSARENRTDRYAGIDNTATIARGRPSMTKMIGGRSDPQLVWQN